jgi:hypothetical protein
MIGDENYNQAKKMRDWWKSLSESQVRTSEQRKGWEFSLALMDATLEILALPKDAPEEEVRAKIAVAAELQQKGLDLGYLVPGPSKENTIKGTD